MRKRLTLTVDEQVCNGLHTLTGRRHISSFVESVLRPDVIPESLDEGYRRMAADEEREAEALA